MASTIELAKFASKSLKRDDSSKANQNVEKGHSPSMACGNEAPSAAADFDSISTRTWRSSASTKLYSMSSSPDNSSLSPTSPSIIILFSWTNALPKHVEKYRAGYKKLYPTSWIIIIPTTLRDLITRSSSSKQAKLTSVIDSVHRHPGLDSVLVHCFSDGGSNKAVEFAEAYQRRTGEQLPCRALCLDSTPGHPRYFSYCAAFRKTLPKNPIVRVSGLVLGYSVLAVFWGMGLTFKGRNNNVISRTRTRLEDKRYWDTEAPRCYMYSEADDLIWWQDIREHGVEAKQNGTPVTLLNFESSAHCAHILESEGVYWNAVADTWRRGNASWSSRGKTDYLNAFEIEIGDSLDEMYTHIERL